MILSRKPPGAARRKSAAVLLALSTAVAGTALAGPGAGVGHASTHREAPLIASDPQVDNTDLYAFASPDASDTATFVANWYPFQEPDGGPNSYPFATDAHYDINIDSQGTGTPDLTHRWTFRNEDRRGEKTFLYNDGAVHHLTDPTLPFRQHYTLREIRAGHRPVTLVKDAIAAPSDVGKAAGGPLAVDLNSQLLNKDVDKRRFVPAEELRLNMSTPVAAKPNRLGVLAGDFQGFPNGRRMGDDVVDIALQALEGAGPGHLVQALAAGDGVDGPGRPFTGSFPYIALPFTDAVNQAG